MRILVTDKIGFQESSRVKLDNGFLKVSGRAARAGVYQYLAKELGITDGDPNRIVNVYRPPEEVFKVTSLESYNGVDVTDDHPTEMVNSKTFKKVSVGHVVSSASQDGNFVNVEMIIKDQAAIDKIESGKVQLSPGYYAEYVKSSGVADGLEYEYKQTDIMVNHVSLVDRGRGGPQVKLFDNQKGGVMPVITIDGKSIEMQDAATATLVQQTIDSMKSTIDMYKKDMEKKEKDMEKMKAEKDMSEEEMEKMKKAKDAAIAELQVYASKEALDDAKAIAGSDFTCDSSDVMTIKRAALGKVRPAIDWADKADAYVEAAYDMEKEKMEDEEEEKEKMDKKAKDSYTKLANDMANPQTNKPVSHFDSYRNDMANAWKQTVNQEK